MLTKKLSIEEMNLNINLPGILQVNLNGGPNSIADMVVVPQPIPKNYGIIDKISNNIIKMFHLFIILRYR